MRRMLTVCWKETANVDCLSWRLEGGGPLVRECGDQGEHFRKSLVVGNWLRWHRAGSPAQSCRGGAVPRVGRMKTWPAVVALSVNAELILFLVHWRDVVPVVPIYVLF